MVAGFSYGFSADGLARHSARPIAGFGIVGICRCGDQTSPRKRDRRDGTAAFKSVHAPRPSHHLSAAVDTSSPAGAQDAGPFAPAERVPHAGVGMASIASCVGARPIDRRQALQRTAQVRRREAFNARPGPNAGCPDRSTRSPRQKAPSTASVALSTRPTPGAPGRMGPRGATVEAAAERSAMSTVRRS